MAGIYEDKEMDDSSFARRIISDKIIKIKEAIQTWNKEKRLHNRKSAVNNST